MKTGVSTAVNPPALRLVREAGFPREKLAVMTGVARENRSAADLSPSDARTIVAEATAAALDGGRSAILAPERRQRLLALAGTIGVRAFDANLVIAVVQDRVRRGENWREWIGQPPGADTLAPQPTAKRPAITPGQLLVIGVLASLIAGGLIGWLMRG